MRVGITGHRGFIGNFLKNYLEHFTHYTPVDKEPVDDFSDVDVVVHLAEKNKGDDKEVYDSNRKSCQNLITSIWKSSKNEDIHLIYASSIHQDDNGCYGLYRRQNVTDFVSNIKKFTAIRIPNVFGPFCNPNYNSFIATFCDKIIRGEEINVNDNNVDLIYVEDLCEEIHQLFSTNNGEIIISSTPKSVKEVYDKLMKFKKMYLDENVIPKLNDVFDLNLFNTFRSYINHEDKSFKVKNFLDERGRLSELLKSKTQGQVFFSTTNSGFVRGNHFHRKRIERFCVLKGKALIEMRKVGTDEINRYEIDGDDYKVIDMPIYYTHSLKNIGDEELICAFWMNDILGEAEVDDTKFLAV